MSEVPNLIIEHYQKTYELTYEMWNQRNRIFISLIAVIGLATLLTFRVPETNSILVDLVAKFSGVTDANRINQLRAAFPFGLLQSILLIVIFYLMVNLYHRALYVLRNYKYLGALENEIRTHLGLSPDSISFTRESTFYWKDRSWILGSVKWFYILILGGLLGLFLGARILDDFALGNVGLALFELFIAAGTALYFLAYAKASVSLDSENVIVKPDSQVK